MMTPCRARGAAVWVAAFLVGSVGVAGQVAAAPIAFETRAIEKTTEEVDIQAQYPVTGNDAIDEAVAGWATGYAAEFEQHAYRRLHQHGGGRLYTAERLFALSRL